MEGGCGTRRTGGSGDIVRRIGVLLLGGSRLKEPCSNGAGRTAGAAGERGVQGLVWAVLATSGSQTGAPERGLATSGSQAKAPEWGGEVTKEEEVAAEKEPEPSIGWSCGGDHTFSAVGNGPPVGVGRPKSVAEKKPAAIKPAAANILDSSDTEYSPAG